MISLRASSCSKDSFFSSLPHFKWFIVFLKTSFYSAVKFFIPGWFSSKGWPFYVRFSRLANSSCWSRFSLLASLFLSLLILLCYEFVKFYIPSGEANLIRDIYETLGVWIGVCSSFLASESIGFEIYLTILLFSSCYDGCMISMDLRALYSDKSFSLAFCEKFDVNLSPLPFNY